MTRPESTREALSSRLRSSDSETGPFDQYEAFSFSISRHTRSPLSEDGTLASISEPSERDPKVPDCQGFDSNAPAGKVYSVLRSRYAGDGIIGGLQIAKLTFTHDATRGIRKGPTPIFRWCKCKSVSTAKSLVDALTAILRIQV
jgi:hypothetical protein